MRAVKHTTKYLPLCVALSLTLVGARRAAYVTTGLDSRTAAMIGEETLAVQKTLASGVTIRSNVGMSAVLVSASIQGGRVADTFRSKPFTIPASGSRVPGEEFFPGDHFYPGDHFFPGDHFLPDDQWVPGNQFGRAAKQIAATGMVVDTRVDWRRQSVLLLAIVPADSEMAAEAQIRTIAFIMNGS